MNELKEKVGSLRSSADKIINDQIDEYMDIITEYKNEKMYYDEDIKVFKHIIQKDLKEKVKKFKAIKR